jgi:hypothetical protein
VRRLESVAVASWYGRRRNGADRYGCSIRQQRGVTVCSNSLLVRRDELEESLREYVSGNRNSIWNSSALRIC